MALKLITNMKNEIINIIDEIIELKTKAKKHPVIISDNELHTAIKKRVLNILRELWKDEKIDFGRSINNNYIQIRNSDSPPRRNEKQLLHKIYD